MKFRQTTKVYGLTNQDHEEWQQYVKHVKPIKKSNKLLNKRPLRTKIKINPAPFFPDYIPTLQSRSSKKNKKTIQFQAFLDLHGMNQDQAYQKLINFIAQSRVQYFRCILIITGKGRTPTTLWWENLGILKELVPRWLNEDPLRAHVASYQHACPENGGEGALYVFLKCL